MTGKRIGRMVVLRRSAEPCRHGWAMWECLCDCGKTIHRHGPELRRGILKSCGCANPAMNRHGLTGTREYRSWCHAKARCDNPNDQDFKYYGDRGIIMCEQWADSFEAFLHYMGKCPPNRSLDRINTNGNYEPGNCRWATPVEQASNRRSVRFIAHEGRVQHMSAWAREFNTSPQRMQELLDKYGLTMEEIAHKLKVQVQNLPPLAPLLPMR